MGKKVATGEVQYSLNLFGEDPFSSWAYSFFNSERMGTLIPKYVALNSFRKYINNEHFSAQKFPTELAKYCFRNNLVLNPDELKNNGGRIIRRYNNAVTEMIYVTTKEM